MFLVSQNVKQFSIVLTKRNPFIYTSWKNSPKTPTDVDGFTAEVSRQWNIS